MQMRIKVLNYMFLNYACVTLITNLKPKHPKETMKNYEEALQKYICLQMFTSGIVRNWQMLMLAPNIFRLSTTKHNYWRSVLMAIMIVLFVTGYETTMAMRAAASVLNRLKSPPSVRIWDHRPRLRRSALIRRAKMFILSFLFGLLQYQDKFAFMNYHDPLTDLLTITCAYCTGVCIVGSMCLKCDITNIIATAIFLIASVGVTLFLCSYILMKLNSKEGFYIEAVDMVGHFRQFMLKTETIPDYLEATQLTYHCCGVYGYKDYRAFIVNLPQSSSEPHTDVPASCCKSVSKDRCIAEATQANGQVSSSSALQDVFKRARTAGNYSLPISYSDLKKSEKFIIVNLYGNETYEDTGDYEVKPKWLIADSVKRLALHREGCYRYLMSNSETLYTCYMALTICVLLTGITVGIFTVQNCVKVKRQEYELHHHHYRKVSVETQYNGVHRASVRGDLSDRSFHPPSKQKSSLTSALNAHQGNHRRFSAI